MARIKYSEEIQPINNEHYGFTFQRNNYGQSMYPASRSGRYRRPRQNQRQHNNQKAVLQWRNMSPETQAAWNLFAATYQQPSKRQPTVFLTGYQIFIKRNSYCFLNHGIESDFMYLPAMELKTYEETFFVLEAGENSIDLTDLYISNFGIIPTVGQYVLFCAIPFSDKSGQFFPPIFDTLEVKAVYVDGFFLNLTLPAGSVDILYSVYLSKPVSAGQSYAGTKIRYMGCFTSKKFTALTDVPAVTPADAGKVWGVNPDGSLGWIEGGGGGGLTCADLVNCPTIISILAQLSNIEEYLSEIDNSSIPPIKLGLLYNHFCTTDPRGLLPSGWIIPSDTMYNDMANTFGSYLVVGGYLKENALTFWISPNTGATNSTLFNGRGGGTRSGSSGVFSALKSTGSHWTSTLQAVVNAYNFRLLSSSSAWGLFSITRKTGYSIRACKLATGVPNFTKSIMIGNDGKIYRTIALNGYYWLADNLAETKWRDGTYIQEITVNATWATLSESALCAYGNDWSNV